jgi:hypothetical protein
MALSFPNQSRAYDATRRAVRFWGNDSAMEASFFVTEDSLKRIQPDMRFDEAGLLAAFQSGCNDHNDLKSDQISRQRWQSIGLISHPAIFDHKVSAFNVAGLVQTSPEAGQPGRVGLR